MRQQRNQDSSSIYRPKDSPTKTPDGNTATHTQQHVQFANPECSTTQFKSSPIHRNLSSPSALHSPKSISQPLPAQSATNGFSPSKVDGPTTTTNGLKRAISNQSYHTSANDGQPTGGHPTSTYDNIPKTNEFSNPNKDYGSYVKPSSPLKTAGSLANDKNIVPIVLSPTSNSLKSKSTVTTTKVTR